MNIRFSTILFLLFFGVSGLFLPAFAHDSIPLDADGCHECRAEDGCFFFDYWSVPKVTRHCHGTPQIPPRRDAGQAPRANEEKSESNPYETKVLRVLSGNEIEVEFKNNKNRALVRLLGVENFTPLETEFLTGPASYEAEDSLVCADKMEKSSREHLEDLVLDKKVELRPSLRGEDALEDGTLLRTVFRGKTLVNEKMLGDGYGMLNATSAFEFLPDFSEADALARSEEKGIWDPEFCKEKEQGALFGTLSSQISRYQSLPTMLQYAFAALGVLGIYLLARLIRRSRVVA